MCIYLSERINIIIYILYIPFPVYVLSLTVIYPTSGDDIIGTGVMGVLMYLPIHAGVRMYECTKPGKH